MRIIRKTDTVHAVVERHPELREVLKDASPKFTKLDNPVMFNTVARVTSLEQAAKIGGVYLRELLYRLNDAIGLGSEYLAEEKAAIAQNMSAGLSRAVESASRVRSNGGAPAEIPAWIETAASFPRMDVRFDAADPFDRVNRMAEGMEPGSGFILVQNFEPVPLMHYLGTRGFENYSHRREGGEYWIYFIKK